jgi:flagellar basal body-associated protein FliL
MKKEMSEAPKAPSTEESKPKAKPKGSAKGTGKKKKKKKKWQPPIRWSDVQAFWKEVARALRSTDGPTRRMAIVFWISIVGAGWTGAWTFKRVFFPAKPPPPVPTALELEQQRILDEFLAKQREDAQRAVGQLLLGSFTFSLQEIPGEPKARGAQNLAEVEISIECDSTETCSRIEASMTSLRDQILAAFSGLDREAVMSTLGRTRMKETVLLKLNQFIGKGRVQKVFFTKLIVN